MPDAARKDVVDFIIESQGIARPLAEGEFSIVEMEQRIMQRYGTSFNPRSRVLGSLKRLEQQGMIVSVGKRTRADGRIVSAFRLTEEGQRQMGEWAS
jgi:DNA-binding PadR family transcriptional regulator